MVMQGTWSVTDAKPGGAPAARPRPYWLIGSALLALIVVVLAVAFLLDRQLRPRVGVGPAAGTSSVTAGTPSRTISGEADLSLLATPLEREVAAAYLRYWAVYGAALESLDSSRLREVSDGNRLQEATADVRELASEGVAARFQVRHSFRVVHAAPTEAAIQDEYVNTSYAVDPQTRQPVGEPGEAQRARNTYYLRRINSSWKVVDAKKGWE
jgi:hypothetical protein